MRYFTIFLLIIFYGCSAQKIDANQSHILTGLKEYKLKGPVKEQRYTASYFKNNSKNDYVNRWINSQSEVAFLVKGYISFDKNGFITSLHEHSIDSLSQEIKNIKPDCYDYNKNDLLTKSKYEFSGNLTENLFDDILLKPNYTLRDDCIESITENADVLTFKFSYSFDKKGNTMVEKSYNYGGFQLTESNSENNLYTKIIYKYNEDGNLIERQVYPGKYGEGENFYFLDATMGLGSDLRIYYEYDDNNRLFKKTVKKDGKIYAQETYIYNLKKNYVEKVKKYVYGISRFDSSNMTITYNEYGDMIQFEYDAAQNMLNTAKVRYYEYEYDEYKNWIKCIMYMQTDKKEPVTMASRKIEYYTK